MLRILTTLLRPTSGCARLMGLDVGRRPYEVRKKLCAVLQENAVEVYLSVEDNLRTYARFHSIPPRERDPRVDRAIELFGLGEQRHQKVIDLSGGLRRRVQVAKVFMVDKPVVFLDEATTGMDPINKRATLETIREQARQGRTIILTTHLLQEAEELCGRIAILDRGALLAVGDPGTIKSLGSAIVEIHVTYEALDDRGYRELSNLPLVRIGRHGLTLDLSVNAKLISPFDVLQKVEELGPVLSFEVSSGSLEDAFIELLARRKSAAGNL
ncbi:MAG TPA: ABC transporter ATP-binding protein [Bacteroidota bacterium]|nr:ABC transporter ATP-binding protein [Bacteroidota bacterium]